jgi:alpha-acetolactate decarboxylase
VKNNKLIGTIGFYSKLVNEESSLNLLIEKYEADGVAYRIDSTESFYLSVPFDNKFVLENFI